MKRSNFFVTTFLLAALAPLLPAQLVPDRYIVEFAGEPAALRLTHQAKSSKAKSSDFKSAAASVHRKAVQQEQAAMRAAIAARERVAILHCIDLVSNACFIHMTAEQAARVAQMPGVKR